MSKIYSKIFKDKGKKFISTDELRQRYDYAPRGYLEFSLKKFKGERFQRVIINFGELRSEGASVEERIDWSIRKWKYITFAMRSTGKIVLDGGTMTCMLCHEFIGGGGLNYQPHTSCSGCPVREQTGETYCADTPYSRYTFGCNGGNYDMAYDGAVDFMNYLVWLRNKQPIIFDADRLVTKKHMHILDMYEFCERANAAGAEKGATTIKCKDCGVTFALTYERVNVSFDVQIDCADFTTHKIQWPTTCEKGAVIGIS